MITCSTNDGESNQPVKTAGVLYTWQLLWNIDGQVIDGTIRLECKRPAGKYLQYASGF